MPMQLSGFLIVIASSTSQAMLSESSQKSHSDNSSHLVNAFKHVYKMLIPSSLLLVSVGWIILKIYGSDYARNGFDLLLLLSFSSLFVAVNAIGDMWMLVKKAIKDYVAMQVLNAVLVILFAYLFINSGLIGVGFGWLIGQLITAVIYILIFQKHHLRTFVGHITTPKLDRS